MNANVNCAEVVPSHYNSLVQSALKGILPPVRGNLIQKDNKLFLERKPLTFLGKPLGSMPDLPNEFILE